MKANQLFQAAIHALTPEEPTEGFVEVDSAVAQITPGAVHVPVEGMMPSLGGATAWLNSPPLTPAGLRGKVVLVDFWTYTCINWLRTLPYVRAWAEKYKDHGVVAIGVHSPEFPFEHDLENVRRASAAMRIEYPIAIDNNFAVWRAFKNHFWPALYVVDTEGQIRHHQFGEGVYDQAEMVIQHLLAEAQLDGIDRAPVSVDARGIEASADWSSVESPETYLGYERAENLASPGDVGFDTSRVYAIPTELGLNEWALSGDWTIGAQAAVLTAAEGRIVYRFHARDLHLVLAPAAHGAPVRFRVLLDGEAPGTAHGVDIDHEGNGRVTEPRLYQLIRQQMPITDRRFEIEFLDPGAGAFVFTFG